MDEQFKTDEELLAERQEQERQKRQRADDDLAALMMTEHGRRLMWRLLGDCRIFEQSFTGDLAGTSFNEGKRSVGNKWFADVHRVCPDLYLKMAKEAKESNQ